MSNTAQEIMNILGNGKFIAMTGAKNLVNHGDALSFKLPNGLSEVNGKKTGINTVKITLNDQDLFDVSFDRIYGVKFTNKAKATDIYVDQLRDTFTATTGLSLSI